MEARSVDLVVRNNGGCDLKAKPQLDVVRDNIGQQESGSRMCQVGASMLFGATSAVVATAVLDSLDTAHCSDITNSRMV